MLFIVATLIRSSPALLNLSHTEAFRRATFIASTAAACFGIESALLRN